MRVGISLLALAPGDLGGSETYARCLTHALASVGTLDYAAFVPASAAEAAAGLPAVPVRELPFARRGPPRIPAITVESRVHVIPLGVDHALFSPGGETRAPFLLYPARPWPHKNHPRLLEAFVLLRADLPELRLVLTGGGLEQLGALPESVERLGIVPV